MTDTTSSTAEAVVIKKYANRRLYNTATSTYVTLEDLAVMVKSGQNFVVFDAKTGEDITRSVLTQIIFEEESKGTNLLPINFLRQLIQFYGDNMQAFVPSYLEFSLENLMKEQGKLQEQMLSAFQADPFRSMEEHAKRNMALFSDAMKMFNPFAAMGGLGTGTAFKPPGSEASKPQHPEADLQAMREQLSAMQDKINAMAPKLRPEPQSE